MLTNANTYPQLIASNKNFNNSPITAAATEAQTGSGQQVEPRVADLGGTERTNSKAITEITRQTSVPVPAAKRSRQPHRSNSTSTTNPHGKGSSGGVGGGGIAVGGTASSSNIKASASRNSNIRSSSSNSTMASNHRAIVGGIPGGMSGGGGGGGGVGDRGVGGTAIVGGGVATSGLQIGSAWFQRKINLRPQHRGVHLVTEEILRQMPELGHFSVGLCHVQSKLFK